MTTARQRASARAIGDRRLPLVEAAARVGYSPETLRHKMFRGLGTPPPLIKVNGRWYAWQSELDEWASGEAVS